MRQKIALLGLLLATPATSHAQSATNLDALRGLAPVATLLRTPAGKAALDANFTVTGAIQTGKLAQPTLLPFKDQQLQALKDVFITDGNAAELSDGLGSKLAAAYTAKAHYTGRRDFTSISPSVANLIAYTNETTEGDSSSAKYFFGNETIRNKAPVSAEAAAILSSLGGVTDVFGKAYHLPVGQSGADPNGNSRPFQTEPSLTKFSGLDYFGKPLSNTETLQGPAEELRQNPSYPSGHTTYGYAESLILALLVPERYQQQIARAAEYGNDRIIVGAHYAMDVLGGRTLALHDLAHLLANDPAYVGQPRAHAPVITDYRAAIKAARADMLTALQAGCGAQLAACATADTSRFANPAANAKFYAATRTYDLPVVHPETAGKTEDVAKHAPEAGYLLTVAFPYLTLAQADALLTQTEGPGGGFLDDGSPFGLYSRLDLYTAAGKAAALAPAR